MEDFEKIKQNIKQIHLSAEEKNTVHATLLAEINRTEMKHSFRWNFFSFKRPAVIAVLGLFAASSIAFAAQNSLPGDILYPIKTIVAEPILRVLHASSAKSQADFEVGIMQTRLNEAKKLDIENKLNPQKEQAIGQALVEQSKRVQDSVGKLVSGKDKKENSELKIENQSNNNKEGGNQNPETIKTDLINKIKTEKTNIQNPEIKDALEHADKVLENGIRPEKANNNGL